METLRRTLLKGAAAALAAFVAFPLRAFAAEWDKALFGIADFAAAWRRYGAAGAPASQQIVLVTPAVAESAGMVPIDVTSNIPGTEEIAIFAEKNPLPLTCRFIFPEGTIAAISLRLRLAETTTVRATAKAGGKYYMTAREIRVVGGGCA